MITRTLLALAVLPGLGLAGAAVAGESGATGPAAFAFVPGDVPNTYRFDTGVLRGLGPFETQSLGLLSLIHI